MTDMAEEYRALPHSDLALPPSAERMDEERPVKAVDRHRDFETRSRLSA